MYLSTCMTKKWNHKIKTEVFVQCSHNAKIACLKISTLKCPYNKKQGVTIIGLFFSVPMLIKNAFWVQEKNGKSYKTFDDVWIK